MIFWYLFGLFDYVLVLIIGVVEYDSGGILMIWGQINLQVILKIEAKMYKIANNFFTRSINLYKRIIFRD